MQGGIFQALNNASFVYKLLELQLQLYLLEIGDPTRIGMIWAAQMKPQALSMILNLTNS